MQKYYSFFILPFLITACGNSQSHSNEESSTKTYNLQQLASQRLEYNISAAKGLISGSIDESKAEVTKVDDKEYTLVETHTILKQNLLNIAYSFEGINTIDAFGNVVKTEDENNLICILQNSVDAMPSEATVPSSSEVTRRYSCNDGSHYTSDWTLTKNSDGEVLFTISKNLVNGSKTNESNTTFNLNDKSIITSIKVNTNYKGVPYTIATN